MFSKKNVINNNQQQHNKYLNGNTSQQQIRNNLNSTSSSSTKLNLKANAAPQLTYANISDSNHLNINYNNKLSNQNEGVLKRKNIDYQINKSEKSNKQRDKKMMHSEDFKSQDCVSINTAEYIIELEVTNNKGKINHLNKKKSFNSSSSLNDITDLEERSQDFSIEKSNNDDLVSLNNLNEEVVLEQLKERFSKNQIYTYIGDILIAMNPLKPMSIYGKKVSNYYQKCENVRDKLPPHVYATAEQCFREMIRSQQSQCILISGESGSGKTETCKYLVQHLLNRTKPFELCLNAKIQEVNPLLEVFGNAKTRINDNSSRFGKYLEIYFEQDGTVVGAKFKEYLLEKSRVVYQNEYESTFHIFYLLFAGLADEEKLHYGLTKAPNKYRFMSNTNIENCLSVENKDKFLAIKQKLNTIGFLNADIDNLIKILVSVILIGDIQFTQKKGNNNDAVQVKNTEIIDAVCELLEMEPSELNDALVSDVQITRGEEIKRERNMVQVCDVRDALAKALYGRLFSWIVNQINHHIQPVEGVLFSYSIGLLDIFGFENFERNSFEQMCINLANEQLHQLFTKYIFKLEIQECLDEQIELNSSDLITFQDNQIILDLFLEKRTGLFALLDEESRFPKATDQSLAIKLHQTLSNIYSDVYIVPKNVGTSFQIVHYAGQVLYNVEGFLEKNRDFLPNNLFYAAKNSNNFLVQELFQCKLTRKGTIAPSDRQSRLRKSMINTFNISPNQSTHNMPLISTSSYDISNSTNTHVNCFETNTFSSKIKYSSTAVATTSLITTSSNSINSGLNPNYLINKNDEHRNSISTHNQYASDKVLPLTVACHFKNSLLELIEKINKCKAYFIRCIKPSPNQENTIMNEFVIKQLRYCSLMHVCKIRKCGFPYRIKFDEFLKWYKAIEICMVGKENNTSRLLNRDFNNNLNSDTLKNCIKCLEYANITNYKIGKSKLFLRYWHIDILNSLAKKLENKVLIAQKITRGWLVRNRIKKMQKTEINNFFNQVAFKSNDLSAKLQYSQNITVLPHQFKAAINSSISTNEINNHSKNHKTGTVLNLVSINTENKKLITSDENKNKVIMENSRLNKNLIKASHIKSTEWPDINEINLALEEFDSMLSEYDIDFDQKENNNHLSVKNGHLMINDTNFRNNQQTKSAISFNNCSKISSNSVYHLVHNNNNKNDNTLKKRNALVAFEFKTLLDKVAPCHSSHSATLYTNNINIEDVGHTENINIINEGTPDILPSPPFIYSDNNFELNPNHSPPSFSSSSSSSSSSSPSSSSSNNISSSSSSSNEENHNSKQRSVSPTEIVRCNRFISPHKNSSNLILDEDQRHQNLRSKSHVSNDTNNLCQHIDNCNIAEPILKNSDINKDNKSSYYILNNEEQSANSPEKTIKNASSNVTIWREELNARNNVQQQIKKQTELSQKIEDSRKNIPEWKKNLLKQKEMKKTGQNFQNCSNLNLIQIPETPELMKHNIFIKKGLATMKT